MSFRKIYFDNASTTPLSQELVQAWPSLQRDFFGNAASAHALGQRAWAAIQNARIEVAEVLEAEPENIYFMSGATEANNLLLRGGVDANGIQTVISSKLEHASVLEPLLALENTGQIRLVYVQNDTHGCIDYAHLEECLEKNKHETCLVSLMHVNNELGNVNDIAQIAELCEHYKTILHSDVVQSIGYRKINTAQQKFSYLSFSAHKLHGPQNVGIAYIAPEVRCSGLIKGGAQEKGLRSGTQSAALIQMASRAIFKAYEKREENNTTLKRLYDYARERIAALNMEVRMNGCPNTTCHKILNFSIKGRQTTESLLMNLNERNIYVSGGSACSSGALKTSRVINNLYPNERGYATIRISFSVENRAEEIDIFIDELNKIYNI